MHSIVRILARHRVAQIERERGDAAFARQIIGHKRNLYEYLRC